MDMWLSASTKSHSPSHPAPGSTSQATGGGREADTRPLKERRNETLNTRNQANMMPAILQPPAHAKKVLSFTPTGAPYKSRDNGGRPCFAVDGEYALETGETSQTRVTSQTKKGLPERIASKQKSALSGQITLENGFEVVRFSIW